MKTMIKALIALLGLILLAACQVGIGYGPALSPPSALPTVLPSSSASPVGSVSFTALLDRDSDSRSEEKTIVISEAADFSAFWTKHAGTSLPQPAIDFAKNTVVAVYKSQASDAGLGFEIVAVTRTGRNISVHYRQRTMQPGRTYLPVISYPIHAVSFPLSRQAGDYDALAFVEDPPQPGVP
ncbi:MAG: hypothetical protein ACAI44_00410 [Candidatus Sericytochromatia bacterium]